MPAKVRTVVANLPFAAVLEDSDIGQVADWFDAFDQLTAGAARAQLDGMCEADWRAIVASQFVRDAMLSEPDYALTLLAGTAIEPLLHLPQDANDLSRALRIYRRQQMLRIAVDDLSGRWSLATVLGALSDLADECLVAALRGARQRMQQRYGQLLDSAGQPVPLLAICMGKLGGRELNFSSDIDVIFTFPSQGASDGRRALEASEYCLREAREVIALLDQQTQYGRVFRVDTRLRPFGEAGPLAISFDALEAYLTRHGRDWERYAFVKARFVAADEAASSRIAQFCDQVIRPFVYRRYVDFGVLDSLRTMKALIQTEVQQDERQDDIKRGPGGIREIEFIAQSWQLIRGGQIEALRTQSLYAALAAACENGCMTDESATQLQTAYDLLRVVENRLQALADQQTHRLPQQAAQQRALAVAMQVRDWSALTALLDDQRARVTGTFDDLLRASGDIATQNADVAWLDRPAARLAVDVREMGLEPADDIAQALLAFAQRLARPQADDASALRTRTLVDNVMLRLRAYQAPAIVLARLLAVAEAVRRRSAYISLLNERPDALDLLLQLCASNQFVAGEIAEHPILIDELLMTPRAGQLTRAALAARMPALRADDDIETQMRALARFTRTAQFHVAVADVREQLHIMQVSDRLSDIAELTLQAVLQLAWWEVTARYGKPAGFAVDAPGVAIIAYGKLGGLELGYGSDLDIVFLHDLPAGQTDGERAIDNTLLALRVARRVVHLLGVQTGHGSLYEVDTRLRPSGRSGLLVSSLAAFERYQRDDAWTWEHQALIRARWVVGDRAVGEQFEAVRQVTLRDHVDRDGLTKAVRDMRARMRESLSQGDAERFDLKQDAGGIADLEFIVQYLVLRDAHRFPELLRWSDNIRQLDSLGAAGVLQADEARALQDIYRSYRRCAHALALDRLPQLIEPQQFVNEQRVVRDFWSRLIGHADRAGSDVADV